MGDLRAELEKACDEHDRLEAMRTEAQARQEKIIASYLDELAARLLPGAPELGGEGVPHGVNVDVEAEFVDVLNRR